MWSNISLTPWISFTFPLRVIFMVKPCPTSAWKPVAAGGTFAGGLEESYSTVPCGVCILKVKRSKVTFIVTVPSASTSSTLQAMCWPMLCFISCSLPLTVWVMVWCVVAYVL